MIHLDRPPLVDTDGKVREIAHEDLKHTRRGRPTLPSEQCKQRVNLTLDPAVIAALKARSAEANRPLKEGLGL